MVTCSLVLPPCASQIAVVPPPLEPSQRLIRNGSLRPSARVTGSLTWTDTYRGKQTASIGYEATMDEALLH